MKSGIHVLLAAFLLSHVPGTPLTGKDLPGRSAVSLAKTMGTPNRARININRFSTGFYNDGISDMDLNIRNAAGGYYPKGSGKTVVFASGVMWAAHYGEGGEVRLGGAQYSSGLQGGKILNDSTREDPLLPKNRIYRVRPDIAPNNRSADVSSEINDGDGTADEIYDQYHKDWLGWPWFDGAPFLDKNADGSYDPSIDVPGVPGADQTLWYVANDMLDAPPDCPYFRSMRIEIQQTVWAYAREGALGDMIFRRSVLINKGRTILDSMYISLWTDPDMGDAWDDLGGCDTTRSLAFVYNSRERDNVFDPLPPPAVGFDFFQGPVVPGSPGDSAIFLGKRVYGKRNLPMTAAYVFYNILGMLGDPDCDRDGVPQWYNYMRGLVGRTGEPYVDPAGVATAYVFAGDPEKRTGWLDDIPYDIRLGLCSGPFTMAQGDTQEIVIAEIAAGAIVGSDRLSAVGQLKFYDDQGQAAYNAFFNIPVPPPPPKVSLSTLEKEIVLSWGNDPAFVDSTEQSNSLGYKFQGYNVYQLPSASADISEAKRIATFDIVDGVSKISDKYFDPKTGTVGSKVKQFGGDSGIKRALRITTDAFNSNLPLINSSTYYIAVTAYNYNPDPAAIPNTLENPILILPGVPHTPNPGSRYAAGYGDTITGVSLITAPGSMQCDGSVIPLIVDPTMLTGHTYAVTFDTVAGQVSWKLTDQTDGIVRLSNQANQSGDIDYLFADGLQVKVLGPPPGMKEWSIPTGTRKFTWADGVGMGLEGFIDGYGNGTIGNAYEHWFSSSTVGPERMRNVVLRLAKADGTWDPVAPPADSNFSRGYRYLRLAQNPPAMPEFAPWIANTSASYAYQDYNYSVPFAAWDVDANPPVRLAVGHLENNVAAGLVDGRYWPPVGTNVGGDANYSTLGPREWFFIFDIPYSNSPNDVLAENILANTLPIMWFGTVCRRAGANSTFSSGDQFEIIPNRINWPGNTFVFTAPRNTVGDKTLAMSDVRQINVFPNPYYGVNPQETDRYVRFVTFTHLPEQAVIRIFNLAGVMVRKIDRNSSSQFEQWDLKNQEGLPVGSGLYIAHIDMPALGSTKILKIAVVQEQQILDRW